MIRTESIREPHISGMMLTSSAKIVFLLLIFFSQQCLTYSAFSTDGNYKSAFHKYQELGIDAVQRNDFDSAIAHLRSALSEDPSSNFIQQLLGSVCFQVGQQDDAFKYLKQAYDGGGYDQAHIVANYIEVLRGLGRLEEARNAGRAALVNNRVKKDAQVATLYNNLALVESELGNYTATAQVLRELVQLDPSNFDAWKQLGEVLLDKVSPIQASEVLTQAVQLFPNNHQIHFLLGVSLHHQEKLNEAITAYFRANELNSSFMPTIANIAAALQSLGRAQDAMKYYEIAIPALPNDAGLINNYGALLGTMGKKEEEVVWLKRALAIDPLLEPALVNLGGHYQDDGLLEEARHYFSQAIPVTPNPGLLQMRMLMLLSPVHSSWESMVEERIMFESNLEKIKLLPREHVTDGKHALDTTLDRIHFYVQYHGINDRSVQEKVSQSYDYFVDDINQMSDRCTSSGPGGSGSISSLQSHMGSGLPLMSSSSSSSSRSSSREGSEGSASSSSNSYQSKARIGFLSKFFGLFEPHGLLLDGVMKYLPREHFRVIVLPVARTDTKPLSPTVKSASDEVHEVSLTYQHALYMIKSLNLDVLVFADTMSEPMTHFLARNRLAPIQMAFWGNPITSGSVHIDYFVSADVMEHPYRTRLSSEQDPYSEQVVLLNGQGIWYERPLGVDLELQRAGMSQHFARSRNFTRAEFGFEDKWFIFLLPQSVFKIHPLYDEVLAEILSQNPTAHLVVTGGRQKTWTKVYLHRLQGAMNAKDRACTGSGGTNNSNCNTIQNRLHLLERVSSEKFGGLLEIADAVLHPFPFDGSKTSADALQAHKPLVTLPSDMLKGRMGAAFMRTMNIPELVATDTSDYIRIATRLCQSREFYNLMKQTIAERVHLIWEDMEYPYEWVIMLGNILGYKTKDFTFEHFLSFTGDRNVADEMAKHEERVKNRHLFARLWGRDRGGQLPAAAVVVTTEVAATASLSWVEDKPEPWLLDDRGYPHQQQHFVDAATRSPIFTNWQRDSSSSSSSSLRSGKVINDLYTAKGEGAVENKSMVDRSLTTDATVSSTTTTDNNSNNNTITTGTTGNSAKSAELDTDNYSDAVQTILAQFREKLRVGQYDAAHLLSLDPILLPFADALQKDPLFLVEKGAAHYFRGDYVEAWTTCHRAAELVPRSSLPYACAGVAGMYIQGVEEHTVSDLRTALRNMELLERLRDRERTSSYSPTNSNSIHNKTMTNDEHKHDDDDDAPFSTLEMKMLRSVFFVTREVVELNLIASYRNFNLFDECLEFTRSLYDLPAMHEGGAHALMFAAVNWTSPGYETRLLAVQNKRGWPSFSSSPNKSIYKDGRRRTLLQEVAKLQNGGTHLLNSAIECLNRKPDGRELSEMALADIIDVVSDTQQAYAAASTLLSPAIATATAPAPAPATAPTNGDASFSSSSKNTRDEEIVLVTQYFIPESSASPSNPRNMHGIDAVLTRNLANPVISHIYLLNEKEYDFSSFPNSKKIRQYSVGERLSFDAVFKFANDHLKGKTVILGAYCIFCALFGYTELCRRTYL